MHATEPLSGNRITLDDLLHVPIGALAALPAEELMLLAGEARAALERSRRLGAWLDGALERRYGARAAELRRQAGKDSGTLRFADGPVTVIAELPKRVVWDQDRLARLAERIRAGGEDPAAYLDVTFKVPERKYAAWPEPIRAAFEPARTVKTGALKVELLPRGGDA